MSVARINQFQASPGNGPDLQKLLLSFVPEIRKTTGCESAQLLVSQGNPDRMVMLEVWADTEAHQAAVRAIPESQIAKMMKLLASPPKGGFYAFT